MVFYYRSFDDVANPIPNKTKTLPLVLFTILEPLGDDNHDLIELAPSAYTVWTTIITKQNVRVRYVNCNK